MCMMAPEPLLLTINEACCHLAKSNFTYTVLDITHYKMFENYIIENTATSPKDQWVNTSPSAALCQVICFVCFLYPTNEPY